MLGRTLEWGGEDPKRNPALLMADGQPFVEVAPDDDAGLSIADALGIREQLQEERAERDGIVIGHCPFIGEAADVVESELRREGPIGRPRLRGRAREARIVARQEALEDGVRLGEGAGPGEAEFTDEAVLEGAPEPLDATFSLRGVGGDPGDAQRTQSAADLGGWSGLPAELFVDSERPVVRFIGDDAVPIAVEGDGDAASPDRLPEHDEVAIGLFVEPEDRRRDLAGRIIDGAVEDEAGATAFQPVMLAAIPLEEQAGRGHALAPPPEATPVAGPGTRKAGGQEDAADGGAGEDDPVDFGEFLGQVLVVEASIGGAGQPGDPALQGGGDAIGSGTAAVPMS